MANQLTSSEWVKDQLDELDRIKGELKEAQEEESRARRHVTELKNSHDNLIKKLKESLVPWGLS